MTRSQLVVVARVGIAALGLGHAAMALFFVPSAGCCPRFEGAAARRDEAWMAIPAGQPRPTCAVRQDGTA